MPDKNDNRHLHCKHKLGRETERADASQSAVPIPIQRRSFDTGDSPKVSHINEKFLKHSSDRAGKSSCGGFDEIANRGPGRCLKIAYQRYN